MHVVSQCVCVRSSASACLLEMNSCAHVLKKVRPMTKLMLAATVELLSTSKVPGSSPKRYPLEAVRGATGIASTSASMYI